MTRLIYEVDVVTPDGRKLSGGVEWVKPGIGGYYGSYQWYIVDNGQEYRSRGHASYLSAQAALRSLKRAAASMYDARATITGGDRRRKGNR